MCLTIITVPTCAREGNLVPCFKSLDYYRIGNDYDYYTPYQRTQIPDDGVLIPQGRINKIRYNGEIRGGAIHANTKKNYTCGMAKKCSYAFGVVAYGRENDADLACKLLYIPDLDKSNQKKKRMETISGWNSRMVRPSNAEVKKLFPNFKPLVEIKK